MTIGENIKRLRKEKKMTQRELGERLGGISQQQIGQWENGDKIPKLVTLNKIATALEVEVIEILELAPEAQERIQESLKCDLKDYIIIEKVNGITHFDLDDEGTLLNRYRQLNSSGKHYAQQRIWELTQISIYTDDDIE